MATSTCVEAHSTSLEHQDTALPLEGAQVLSSHQQQEIVRWTSLLRENLKRLYPCVKIYGDNVNQPQIYRLGNDESPIDETCFDAPRRKDPDPIKARLAISISELLYPGPSDSTLGPLIKYHDDIQLLRRVITQQRKAAATAAIKENHSPSPAERILAQGPWDEVNDPISLGGVAALPMSVKISSRETLEPFFDHLSNGGTYSNGTPGKEEFYNVEMGEWEKGIIYRDRRMDLCKQVVGPPHIIYLLDSLETNSFVRHFLLGNNMIGPVGAKRIASFVKSQPDKMETWYLAGNCIDTSSFKTLAEAFITSPPITNIWLKRNPLGRGSIPAMIELVTRSPNLRTLDLDQTELGNKGVAELFTALAEKNTPNLSLRNVYLNGNGTSISACKSIAAYLSSPNCALESLYASNNPIGDSGAQALAAGLGSNSSLIRLSLRSCGLKSAGAIEIMDVLSRHPRVMTLDIGQSFATHDLQTRYNYLDDSVLTAVKTLIESSTTLRYFDLGITALSIPILESMLHAVSLPYHQLLVFKAESLNGKTCKVLRQTARERLAENVKTQYGKEMSYEVFEQGEKRWLLSPKDVRLIDSSYRNRDSALARRGLKVLDKWWSVEGEMEKVLNGE